MIAVARNMTASRHSPETVTRTFRIDRDVDDKLGGLSTEERVSMNQIANKALRRYVEWESNAEKFGTVTTSGSTIKKFFDYLTVEQAKEMGRCGARTRLLESSLSGLRNSISTASSKH